VRAWAGWKQVAPEHPAGSLPIGADTLFRVASISKLAQALACMRLHEAGLLRLDEDLAALWGDALRHPLHPHLPITARLLLTHRSGLLDRVSLPLASGDVLRRTLTDRTQWGPEEPGRMFRYSNLGCAVLATVMETAAGEPYDRLMQHRLFEPLGLRARFSTAALTPADRNKLATLYRRPLTSESWVPQADLPGEPPHAFATPAALAAIGENASVHSPAGGLRASMDDLLRIAQLLMAQGQWEGRQLISRQGMTEMLQPHWTWSAQSPGETLGGLFRSWCLGMQRFTDTHDALGGDRLAPRGGATAVGHVGMAYGLFSGLMVLPPKGRQPARGLVYVINGTSQGAAEAVGRHSSFRRCEERVIEKLLEVLESTAITA
jgi:CubicO group peptidase (beta-lactamase class C family)